MNLREPEDRNNTVRISSRRCEESPYVSRYHGPNLVRGVYAGPFFAIFNGEDPVRKYWIARSSTFHSSTRRSDGPEDSTSRSPDH